LEVYKTRTRAVVTIMHGGFQARETLKQCQSGAGCPVLGSAKLAMLVSESEQELLPLVERTVELFGKPLSTVRDMGKGGAAAVAPLHSAGVVDLLCHYHFLKAVGIRLFKACYTIIMTVLRDKAIRGNLRALLRQLRPDIAAACDETSGAGRVRESLPAMIYWALEGDAGQRARFPFALPHLDFVRRCRHVASHAFEWIPQPHTELERRALDRLLALVDKLDDERMREAAGILDMRWPAFCELRGVLRVTNADLPGGGLDRQPELLPAMELLRLQQIEQEVTRYVRRLEEKVAQHHGTSACGPGAAEQIILSYLHEHGAKLFGHPVRRDEDGSVLAVVQRTNNCPEHFFSQDKGRLRQRVRHAHLAQDLEQQPAQAALAANLRHAGYVRPLCGSLENLLAAFAALPAEALALASALVRDHRDARLQRVAQELVSTHGGIETTAQRPAASTPSESPPVQEGDLHARLQAVAGMTEQELRQRCADLFPANAAQDLAPAAPAAADDKAGHGRRTPHCGGARPRTAAEDARLPAPGTVLTRAYGGLAHEVRVLEAGFEYQGTSYRSLSRIAKEITGTSWNGFVFFGLATRDERPVPAPAADPAPPRDAELVAAQGSCSEPPGKVHTSTNGDDTPDTSADAPPAETHLDILPTHQASPETQALLRSESIAPLPADPTRPLDGKPFPARDALQRDPRLPAPGTVLTRAYGGLAHEVRVLEAGFEYQGTFYGSLSPIAKEITRTSWNGFVFFGLALSHGRPATAPAADPAVHQAADPTANGPCFELPGMADAPIGGADTPPTAADTAPEMHFDRDRVVPAHPAPAQTLGPILPESNAPSPADPTRPLNGKPFPARDALQRDPRLPAPGTVLTRAYGGLAHEVRVLETGFEYQGTFYGSLSPIAKEITGTSWNGYAFFGLSPRRGRPSATPAADPALHRNAAPVAQGSCSEPTAKAESPAGAAPATSADAALEPAPATYGTAGWPERLLANTKDVRRLAISTHGSTHASMMSATVD